MAINISTNFHDLGQYQALFEQLAPHLGVPIIRFYGYNGTKHSMQLAIVAELARKFSWKAVWLNLDATEPRVIVEEKRIVIDGLQFCIPFLRLMGQKLSKLVLTGDERDLSIGRHINDFCANTLTSMTFNYRSEFGQDDFVQPFNAVDTVRIIDCDLGASLCHFGHWFPNVRQLKIYEGSRDNRSTYVHFPCLQNLSISFAGIGMLRANPQIIMLELNLPWQRHIKFLDWLVFNPSVIKLSVKVRGTSSLRALSGSETQQLIREHPLIVELNLPQFQLNSNNALTLVRGLKRLKKLQFQLKERHEFSVSNGNWQLYYVDEKNQYVYLSDYDTHLHCK